MLRPALIAATLLLVSGCREDPTDPSANSSAKVPSLAASASGIQAVALGGSGSLAFGINESGLTVGSVDGNGIATVWTSPGAFTVVGPGLFSHFNDVNDQGEAVGYW